jgi:hypothetical protein
MSVTDLREAGFFADPSAATHVGDALGSVDGGTALDNAVTIDHETIDHATVGQDTIDHATVGQDTIDHATVGHDSRIDLVPVDHGSVDHGAADAGALDHGHLQGSGADLPHTQHVTTAGDGKTPELLLKNLQPDTRYIVDNTYLYETDSRGRVVYAEGHLDQTLDVADRVRNEYQQKLAGGADRLPGDHGGHFFGTLFGGPGEGINLTAQNGRLVNLGEFKVLENTWADAIREGKPVHVEITAVYPGDKLRPSEFKVTYQIGDEPAASQKIKNPEP